MLVDRHPYRGTNPRLVINERTPQQSREQESDVTATYAGTSGALQAPVALAQHVLGGVDDHRDLTGLPDTDKSQDTPTSAWFEPGLLVEVHRRAKIRPRDLIEGGGKPDPREDGPGTIHDLDRQSQAPPGQLSGEDHPDGVGFTVAPGEVLVGLDGVSQGVPIIQSLAANVATR